MSADYEFNISSLRETLCFAQSTLINGDFNGDKAPTIQKVAEVLVYRNLVKSNNSSFTTTFIHSFTPDTPFGSSTKITPNSRE